MKGLWKSIGGLFKTIPRGFYTVVRRFSSKEEKRRIVARVVRPEDLQEAEWIGFENHLNVFHSNKQGLAEELAFGLAAYLNSSMVDDFFRSFSGHTQVNATDLRLMKYPPLQTLIKLGSWARQQTVFSQKTLDEQVAQLWQSM